MPRIPHLLLYLHGTVSHICVLTHMVSHAPSVHKGNFYWLALCRFPFATSCHHCTFSPVHLHFPSCVLYCGPTLDWWMGPRPFTVWQMVIYQNQADNYPGSPPVPGLCLKVQQTDLQTVGLLASRTAHTKTFLSILHFSIILPFQWNFLYLLHWQYPWSYGGHIPPGHLVSDSLFANKWRRFLQFL